MDTDFQNPFIVFVRDHRAAGADRSERELVRCASYAEAAWVRQECASPHRRCIIRYLGPAGGGD